MIPDHIARSVGSKYYDAVIGWVDAPVVDVPVAHRDPAARFERARAALDVELAKPGPQRHQALVTQMERRLGGVAAEAAGR